MFNNLIIKRLLAGIVDVIIILSVDRIISIFGVSFSAFITLYYYLSFHQYRTTLGGALLNIKTISSNGKDVFGGRNFLKSFIITIIFFIIGVSNIQNSVLMSYLVPSVTILIIVSSAFFTRNCVTLVDFLSRTRVITDEKYSYKEYKKFNLSILLVAATFVVSFWVYTSVKIHKCIKLGKQHNFEAIIKKCKTTAKLTNNPYLYYLLGHSYSETGRYNKSIEYFRTANILGQEEANFALVKAYLIKKDYNNAINIAKKNTNNITMLPLLSAAYALKNEDLNIGEDFILSHVYAKIFIIRADALKDREVDNVMEDILSKSIPFMEEMVRSKESKMTESQLEASRIITDEMLKGF
ncbi:MAG: hypothetical protein ACJAW3_000516 [Lentimonas sp.]|jgi:hypothetical protein